MERVILVLAGMTVIVGTAWVLGRGERSDPSRASRRHELMDRMIEGIAYPFMCGAIGVGFLLAFGLGFVWLGATGLYV